MSKPFKSKQRGIIWEGKKESPLVSFFAAGIVKILGICKLDLSVELLHCQIIPINF